jgi:WhiB family transcriptional regulator, redox-sensing transcriptional regulator
VADTKGGLEWRREASCLGAGTSQFFLGDEPDGVDSDGRGCNYGSVVRGICAGCPVRVQCLDYAMVNYIVHGFWGGMTPQERKALRKVAA